MTIPIGRFLTEFALHPTPQSLIALAGSEHVVPDADGASAQLMAIEDARCSGFREGAAEAERRAAAHEAELQALHAERLAAERRSWAEQEGTALAQNLAERLDALESRIAAAAASVLEPLLPQVMALRTVAELKEAIGSLLSNDAAGPIVVSGRPDLLASMERAFTGRSGIRFEPADVPDVEIAAGETLVRSSLRSWADKLAAELAAQA